MLQLLARQYHPNLCDAIKTCNNFCDHQCPVTALVSVGYVDSVQQQQHASRFAIVSKDSKGKTLDAGLWARDEVEIKIQEAAVEAARRAATGQ